VRDRRVTFFLIAAVLCVLLVPPTPPQFRWVAEVTAAAYVLLAVLVALDSFSRSRLRARTPNRLRARTPNRLRARTPNRLRARTPNRSEAREDDP
jgi:hypothetical protein